MPILVNGERIEDSVVREEIAAMRPRYEEVMADMDPLEREIQLKDWARENVIERVLLRQEAQRQADPSCLPEELVERFVERLTASVPPPKPKQITEYYRANKNDFWMPEFVRAAHIVKHIDENTSEEEARAAMDDLLKKLEEGADFADLADEYSDCPGGGGDLGWFTRGQMVPEFEEVVFNLKPGERSGVFRTVFGYHIARVLDRRPEGVADFDDVKDRIAEILHEEKRREFLGKYLDELRAAAKVEFIR